MALLVDFSVEGAAVDWHEGEEWPEASEDLWRTHGYGFTLTHDGLSEEIVLKYVCLSEDQYRTMASELSECFPVEAVSSVVREIVLRAVIASKGDFDEAYTDLLEQIHRV